MRFGVCDIMALPAIARSGTMRNLRTPTGVVDQGRLSPDYSGYDRRDFDFAR